MQLVLDTNGMMVRKRNNSFWLTAKNGQKRLIGPSRIRSIAVTADCLISTGAIRLAATHKIPIYFFNAAAKVEARMSSPSFVGLAEIRRQQVLFGYTVEATRWVIELFHEKYRQQQACMKFILKYRKGKKLLALYDQSLLQMEKISKSFQQHEDRFIPDCAKSLMGIEGNLASVYWKFLSASLQPPYSFPKRSRMPAQDMFNAALNYLYGMLYSTVEQAALAAGLDSHMGYLHRDMYQKPSLVFDMIEPYRPWVDRLLMQLCFERKYQVHHVEEIEGGVQINKIGKKILISSFNDFMEQRVPIGGRRLRRSNYIFRFTGEFSQYLLSKQNQNDDLFSLLRHRE